MKGRARWVKCPSETDPEAAYLSIIAPRRPALNLIAWRYRLWYSDYSEVMRGLDAQLVTELERYLLRHRFSAPYWLRHSRFSINTEFSDGLATIFERFIPHLEEVRRKTGKEHHADTRD